MPNDLDLNLKVNYRMNYLNKSHLIHGRLLFRLLDKNSQYKQFYDNSGGYIHQYNDTVREFHLH